MPKFPPRWSVLTWRWGNLLFRCWQTGVLLLVFLAAALCSIAPVLPEFRSSVPAPAAGVRTVPLFNVWTIVWNSVQLEEQFARYWDAPVFFPEPRSFAFSEPQPATLILAPLQPHRRAPALAFNIWLVASLTLNGLFAARLLKCFGVPLVFMAAAGTGMVLHPLVHHQLDSAQLVPLWPSLWTMTALVQLRQAACATDRGWGRALLRGIEAGVAFCCTAACALHHALFLALLLLLTGWLLIPVAQLRRWLPGAVAGAMVSLSLVPFVLVIRSALSDPEYVREESLITQLSAEPIDLARTSGNAPFNLSSLRGRGFFPLNPGWIRLTAAAAACLGCFGGLVAQSSDQRAALRFLVALAVIAAFLAMGTRLHLGSWKVWSFLADSVPGFAQVRSPFRFGYFFQAAVLLLGGIGGACCCRLRIFAGRLLLRRGFAGLLALILGSEVLPGKLQLVGVPDPGRSVDWVEEVQRWLPPDRGLLILPAAPASGAAAFEETARWMIRCTASGIPLVNGYSGFFPASHYDLQKRLQQPWSTELSRELQRRRVGLVYAAEAGSARQLSERPDNGLELIWQNERTRAALFRINPR